MKSNLYYTNTLSWIFIVLVKKTKNIDIKFSVDDTFLE